jgi:hypothetical protein
MKIIKLLKAYKRAIFNARLKIVKVNFIGNELSVYEGTIGDKVDKDDAWFFELSKWHDKIFVSVQMLVTQLF